MHQLIQMGRLSPLENKFLGKVKFCRWSWGPSEQNERSIPLNLYISTFRRSYIFVASGFSCCLLLSLIYFFKHPICSSEDVFTENIKPSGTCLFLLNLMSCGHFYARPSEAQWTLLVDFFNRARCHVLIGMEACCFWWHWKYVYASVYVSLFLL